MGPKEILLLHGQSGLGSNNNEEDSTLLRSTELEPHHQIQLCVMFRTCENGVCYTIEDVVGIF